MRDYFSQTLTFDTRLCKNKVKRILPEDRISSSLRSRAQHLPGFFRDTRMDITLPRINPHSLLSFFSLILLYPVIPVKFRVFGNSPRQIPKSQNFFEGWAVPFARSRRRTPRSTGVRAVWLDRGINQNCGREIRKDCTNVSSQIPKNLAQTKSRIAVE